MPKNHVHLILSFVAELKDLMMVQLWIQGARALHPNNQHLQLLLDRKQAEVEARQDEIHDQMFEISRSN